MTSAIPSAHQRQFPTWADCAPVEGTCLESEFGLLFSGEVSGSDSRRRFGSRAVPLRSALARDFGCSSDCGCDTLLRLWIDFLFRFGLDADARGAVFAELDNEGSAGAGFLARRSCLRNALASDLRFDACI